LETFNWLREEGILGDRQLEVFDIIVKQPFLTDREITRALEKEDPNYVRPRRRELEQLNIIKESGKKICTITRRKVCIWEINKEITLEEVIHNKYTKKVKCPYCDGTGRIEQGQIKLKGWCK
jgi:hypothetical protein